MKRGVRSLTLTSLIWMVMEADPSIVESMMSDPERAEEMQAAGVTSAPQVWVS